MICQVQVTQKYFTNVPEDVITNTWHFDHPVGAPNTTDFVNLKNRLTTFYNNAHSPTAGGQWAPWINLALGTIKIYDVADPQPRAPKYTSAMSLTAGTNQVASSATPPETAICLSYQADVVSGVPQARRRGRIFLGGWGGPNANGTSSAFPIISAALCSQICSCAAALLAGVAADGWIWIVHSGTVAGNSIVSNGWVDNATDTQRRRGQAPSLRQVF